MRALDGVGTDPPAGVSCHPWTEEGGGEGPGLGGWRFLEPSGGVVLVPPLVQAPSKLTTFRWGPR